jgi:membrane fusion protein, multidrug efflux system
MTVAATRHLALLSPPNRMNKVHSLGKRQPRPPSAGPHRVGFNLPIRWMFAGVLIAAAGCVKQAPEPVPPPLVQVLVVSATNVPLTAEFIGQLDSPQNVEVRARVEAFVDEVLFEEGREVSQGAPLFRLDQKPFLERLAAAEGQLAEARAALNKYHKDVARLEPLAEKKAIPQQDLDNAVASVSVGEANVQSAEARAQSARLDLSYCDVLAPVSGVIGARQVSMGSLVGKGEPTLLATISALDPIWFYCAISEVEYLRARRTAGRHLGETVPTLILADGSEFPEPGKWVFVDRAVDVSTGTIRARAQFPNPEGVLRPGMFARVRVRLKTEQDSILIPIRAVQELQGRYFVWVVSEGDQASQRAIERGAEVGNQVMVLAGLKVGERIIVEGVQKVREGSPVQPKTAEQMAALAAQAAAARPAAGGPGVPGSTQE